MYLTTYMSKTPNGFLKNFYYVFVEELPPPAIYYISLRVYERNISNS
jgi:hypothetical protein